MSNQPHIIILGAGVIGLTTAYKLLHLPTPPTITLLATDLPTSPASATFTSPAAGAHFRPQSTSPLIQRFDEETYAFWSSHPAPDAAGLSFPSSYYYYESGDDPEVLGGFSALASLRDFRVLGKGELPSGCVAGVTYTTVSLSPVRYMAWLLSECVGLGARVVQGRVGSLEEVFRVAGLESATAVANCTGIAAGKLVGDAAVYAIKGQTVLVRGECEAVRFRKTKGGWQDLVLRRPGEGSILGVLKVDGDWSVDADPAITEKILERCKELAPELLNTEGKFDVLSVNVGLRPARKGGVRIEAEKIVVGGRERVICHHYGHGGTGFQNSIGSANEAVRVLVKAIGELGKQESVTSKL